MIEQKKNGQNALFFFSLFLFFSARSFPRPDSHQSTRPGGRARACPGGRVCPRLCGPLRTPRRLAPARTPAAALGRAPADEHARAPTLVSPWRSRPRRLTAAPPSKPCPLAAAYPAPLPGSALAAAAARSRTPAPHLPTAMPASPALSGRARAPPEARLGSCACLLRRPRLS